MTKNKAIGYIIFYLWVMFFFSFYSYILDLIFYIKEYGSTKKYIYSVVTYPAYFIFACFPVAVPLSILYNWVALNGFDSLHRKHIIRVVFGVFVGVNIGLILRDGGPSFYIGHFRTLKNLILYPLVLLSVEIVRIITAKKKLLISNSTNYVEENSNN